MSNTEVKKVCKRVQLTSLAPKIIAVFKKFGREIEYSNLIIQKKLANAEKERMRSQYDSYKKQILRDIIEKGKELEQFSSVKFQNFFSLLVKHSD